MMDVVKSFLNLIRVMDTDMQKIRIGNEHDGGYVAYRELCDTTGTVYSVGVGNDVGFELDYAKRFPSAEIQLFDPEIRNPPQDHRRFTFHKVGLGLKWEPLKGVSQDSLLKMDIEWHEWGALTKFEEHELIKFSQLLIEFHIVHVQPRQGLTPYFQGFYDEVFQSINQDLFGMYTAALQRVLNHFYIFHIHANNSLPVVCVNGCNFPPLMELSFVRKDLATNPRLSKTRFPIPILDCPNKMDRPDILDFYPFWGSR